MVPLNAKKTTIKAVTFDLWNTLLFESDDASATRAATRAKNVAEALHGLGLDASVDQVTSAVNKTINSLLRTWGRNKDVTHVEQLHMLVGHAFDGKVIFREEWISRLSSAYISPIYEVPPYINPDTHEVLRWLKDHDKHIGLICNTGITPGFSLRKILTRESIAQYFDAMTFSDEVGIRKPDPKIFRLTTHKLKAKPSETVHVGDNLRADVWGAKGAGLKAIHLDTMEGKDKTALSDPTSMVSRSANLGTQKTTPRVPDKTIAKLQMLPTALAELNSAKPLRP